MATEVDERPEQRRNARLRSRQAQKDYQIKALRATVDGLSAKVHLGEILATRIVADCHTKGFCNAEELLPVAEKLLKLPL